jgi:hypothetical protein
MERSAGNSDLAALLGALGDFDEFGTVTLTKKDQITLPSAVREAFGLEQSKLYFLYGSPSLGLLMLTGQHRDAAKHLVYLLEGKREAPE